MSRFGLHLVVLTLLVAHRSASATDRDTLSVSVLLAPGADESLARRLLDQTTGYLHELSFGRLTMRTGLTSGWVPAGGTSALSSASASVRDRRALLRKVFGSCCSRTNPPNGIWLIVAHDHVWPFTMHYPLREWPQLRSVAVICQDTDWGTLAHELGHVLGLPDLYDQDYCDQGLEAARTVGPWCLMSRSEQRPGLCAWGLMRLGWLEESSIVMVNPGEARRVTLEPLYGSHQGEKVIQVRIGRSRYYLVEYRAQKGIDAVLPAEGVLITAVNYFADHLADRVQVVDAEPRTTTLADAAFSSAAGHNMFIDDSHGIRVAVRGTDGTGLTVMVINEGDGRGITP